MGKFYENSKRSIFKAISFRILVIVSNFIIVFSITKRYDITLSVLLLANIVNTFLYFAHERMWNDIHWGKHHKK